MAQQGLGRKDHQWLAHTAPVLTAEHLPPQQVEVLRRCGAARDLHIILGAQRQESLDARA